MIWLCAVPILWVCIIQLQHWIQLLPQSFTVWAWQSMGTPPLLESIHLACSSREQIVNSLSHWDRGLVLSLPWSKCYYSYTWKYILHTVWTTVALLVDSNLLYRSFSYHVLQTTCCKENESMHVVAQMWTTLNPDPKYRQQWLYKKLNDGKSSQESMWMCWSRVEPSCWLCIVDLRVTSLRCHSFWAQIYLSRSTQWRCANIELAACWLKGRYCFCCVHI